MPIIIGLVFPDPPAGASGVVCQAYGEGLAANWPTLSADDLRLLRQGVQRGELWFGPDPARPECWCWLPVLTVGA